MLQFLSGGAGTGKAARRLVSPLISKETGRSMRKELLVWRSEAGSRLWLLTLIAAMEDASCPELRQRSVDARTVQQLQAQLAFPSSLLPCQVPSLH